MRFKQNFKKKLGVDLPAFEGNLKSKKTTDILQRKFQKGCFKL